MPPGVDAGTTAPPVPALPALTRLRHDLQQQRKLVRSDKVDKPHPSSSNASHSEPRTPVRLNTPPFSFLLLLLRAAASRHRS